ncbi:hypothetical protein GCM10009802_19140 [Streptomyces synnematoformans]|uniref:Uncharacterized protein n=1 Tax=Streptomyces synnematoformans TaxID=415721 RepID=A0ABN2XWD5_9ACTN
MGRLTSKVDPQERQRYSYRGMAHSISPRPGKAAGRTAPAARAVRARRPGPIRRGVGPTVFWRGAAYRAAPPPRSARIAWTTSATCSRTASSSARKLQ